MRSPRSLRSCPLALASVLATAIPALSQVPVGSDFQVNTYTTGNQVATAVGMAPDGTFVVAWMNLQGYTVQARHFEKEGPAFGPEFRAHLGSGRFQSPAVASGTNRKFIVVWDAVLPASQDVQARLFDHFGPALGAEFTVSVFTTNAQIEPSVAADPLGRFVIAWWGSTAHDGVGVAARRFGPTGVALGGDIRVNTYTTDWQIQPRVAVDSAGRFVVVWSSLGQDGSDYGVFGQRFDAAGQPAGAEFRVNSSTSGAQYDASVGIAPDGAFLVAWHSQHVDATGDIFAQRYDASGSPQGGEFRVNTDTAGFQLAPRVAADRAGTFVISWHCTRPDDLSTGVCGRRFEGNGTPRGAEFHVNSYTPGAQAWSWATMDAVGNFVVSWESDAQDGSGRGIFARRFGGLLPNGLSVDVFGGPGSDRNGVLEPGESVDVRPGWLNTTGSPKTFSGSLSNIAGPAGAVYAITDGTGDYGTVNSAQTCLDCYGISVSNPPVRPAPHWDVSALESLLPDVQGQRKPWAFHVGDSFADMPRPSVFYYFVEALLHHAVTGGCAASSYCPSASTAREQMAVFVLVAKEGPGYTPPPCTTPLFADVPAGSPFCRWIEELARRGVVTGCGGGNFCPSMPVPREQMPVFVLRTLDPTMEPPPCTTPMFADVPASSPYCRWIEELVRLEVVAGCGNGNYCPSTPVTREQMAVFITATFGLGLYGP